MIPFFSHSAPKGRFSRIRWEELVILLCFRRNLFIRNSFLVCCLNFGTLFAWISRRRGAGNFTQLFYTCLTFHNSQAAIHISHNNGLGEENCQQLYVCKFECLRIRDASPTKILKKFTRLHTVYAKQ